jgi:hypothetical protein
VEKDEAVVEAMEVEEKSAGEAPAKSVVDDEKESSNETATQQPPAEDVVVDAESTPEIVKIEPVSVPLQVSILYNI